ncbi:vgr related protein [Novosphingobium sp. 9U]|uniref:vgr related protein n=1 Tax=Novosphingobium sp. 9U TaxID=2653158 RepID=UPI0012F115AC|nr:vgr related protein [Novosphingobium sp. 9U]VWX51558.1 Vgr related protein [Novosphingobium sp. 9U]
MIRSVFGKEIDCKPVRVKRRRWFPFQPVNTLMAPTGHVHFHPRSSLYVDDFAHASLQAQALFLHEMTHVWQTQHRGRWYLPLMRHPLCRYDYVLRPGWRLERYGLEQQAEIVRHVFLLERGVHVPGASPLESYRGVLPFRA